MSYLQYQGGKLAIQVKRKKEKNKVQGNFQLALGVLSKSSTHTTYIAINIFMYIILVLYKTEELQFCRSSLVILVCCPRVAALMLIVRRKNLSPTASPSVFSYPLSKSSGTAANKKVTGTYIYTCIYILYVYTNNLQRACRKSIYTVEYLDDMGAVSFVLFISFYFIFVNQ